MNFLLSETEELIIPYYHILDSKMHCSLWVRSFSFYVVSNCLFYSWRLAWGHTHKINFLNFMKLMFHLSFQDNCPNKSTGDPHYHETSIFCRTFLLLCSVQRAPELHTSCICATGGSTQQFSPSSFHPDFLPVQSQKYREMASTQALPI